MNSRLKRGLKDFIKHSAPSSLLRLYRYVKYSMLDGYARKSYSQEGEDLILTRIFELNTTGFYVDVGAHHPQRFSNTHLFYQRGWSGINIEPNSETIGLFKKYRPRDINLELGISDEDGCLTYYIFNDPALNCFDEGLATSRERQTDYYIVGTKEVKMHRLGSVLQEYLPQDVHIDFMSIDAEGHDLHVIKSNDWTLYRPSCVVVEVLASGIKAVTNSHIDRYLESVGYEPFAKSVNSVFYFDIRDEHFISRFVCR